MTENELVEVDENEKLIDGLVLSPKELAFCEAFANPESATFGNARKSAEAAGYREPHNAGWKLRRRPRIIGKLREYHEAVTVAVGRVLADLENERRLAVEKGDLSTAVRASELMGKHLGMFRDVLAVDDLDARLAYNEREALEVRKITALLLQNPQAFTDATPALPAPKSAEQEQARPVRASPADFAALEAARQVPQEPRTRQESE